MNKMNMPGFTADASLYRTSASYQSTAKAYSSGEQQVVPQFWRELWNDFIKPVVKVGCAVGCAGVGAAALSACEAASAGVPNPACAYTGYGAAALCNAGCGAI